MMSYHLCSSIFSLFYIENFCCSWRPVLEPLFTLIPLSLFYMIAKFCWSWLLMLLLLFHFTFLHNCPILLQLVTDAIPDENVDERTSNGEGVFSFCNTDRIFVIVSLSIIYHSDIHTKLSFYKFYHGH